MTDLVCADCGGDDLCVLAWVELDTEETVEHIDTTSKTPDPFEKMLANAKTRIAPGWGDAPLLENPGRVYLCGECWALVEAIAPDEYELRQQPCRCGDNCRC